MNSSYSRSLARCSAESALRLVALQLLRDIALGVLHRLFAHVVRRHAAAVRVRDLDVEAEDLVVGDLERVDPGPRHLAGLVVGQPLLAVATDRPQAIQLPAFTPSARMPPSRSASGAPARIVVQIRAATSSRCSSCCASASHSPTRIWPRTSRIRASRASPSPSARTSRGVLRCTPSRPTMRSMSPMARSAWRSSPRAPGVSPQRLDRVLAPRDLRHVAQRVAQPVPQQPRAHRVAGPVPTRRQQRALPRAGAQRALDLQGAQRHRIEHHVLVQRLPARRPHVQRRCFLRLADIPQQATRGLQRHVHGARSQSPRAPIVSKCSRRICAARAEEKSVAARYVTAADSSRARSSDSSGSRPGWTGSGSRTSAGSARQISSSNRCDAGLSPSGAPPRLRPQTRTGRRARRTGPLDSSSTASPASDGVCTTAASTFARVRLEQCLVGQLSPGVTMRTMARCTNPLGEPRILDLLADSDLVARGPPAARGRFPGRGAECRPAASGHHPGSSALTPVRATPAPRRRRNSS